MSIGQLFFALVDDVETFDDAIHNRIDLPVFSLKISQSESEYARAELVVTNPREGLLAAARKQRIFISCERTPGSLDIVLLFSGRILALPTDIDGETVTFEYLAQPTTWETDLADALDALKVAPYYNEIFLAPEDRLENSEVLSAYSGLLEWNRASGAVEFCDFIEGNILIDIEDNLLYDGFDLRIGDPPVNTINLILESQWNQLGVGEVDVAEAIRLAFTNTAIATPQINTLTPQSFESGWKGIKIPSGYDLIVSNLYSVANSFGLGQEDLTSLGATVDGTAYLTSEGFDTGGNRVCSVARVWYKSQLDLLATYKQKRREQVAIAISASVQNYSVNGQIVEELTLRTQDPVAAVNGAVLDPAYPSFFLNLDLNDFSTYGKDAIEYGILRSLARLKKAARCVEVSFDGNLDDFLEVTCAHSVRGICDLVPNENFRGKVIAYSIEVDGDGSQIARITLGCSIGNGEDSVGSMGDIEIAQKDYPNEPDEALMSSALYYSLGGVSILEPIDVQEMETDDQYLIDLVTVEDDGESQNTGFAASATPDIYLQNNKTRVTVDLKSMNPEPELFNEIAVGASEYTIPRQINLGDP